MKDFASLDQLTAQVVAPVEKLKQTITYLLNATNL